MLAREDRFIGCLVGSAVGDALGVPRRNQSSADILASALPLEFARPEGAAEVIVPVAELGISEYGEPLGPGQWASGTQLMIALAETLIDEGGLFVPEAWAHMLVRWLNEAPRLPDSSSLQAALQLRTGGVLWDEASDPNGSGSAPAARVAPVALLFSDDPLKRRVCAITQAQVTHEDPDSHAGALAVAEYIALAVQSEDTEAGREFGPDSLATVASIVEAHSPDFAEMARCIRLAETLLREEVPPVSAARALGVSDWAREAVTTALYFVARGGPDFETVVSDAIAYSGGATETIGAIVGAVSGAIFGAQGIPARWKTKVEGAADLVEIAHALDKLM